MRNIDFDPFWRYSIGFDRLFAMIDETLEPEDRYPPYNILRTGEDERQTIFRDAPDGLYRFIA